MGNSDSAILLSPLKLMFFSLTVCLHHHDAVISLIPCVYHVKWRQQLTSFWAQFNLSFLDNWCGHRSNYCKFRNFGENFIFSNSVKSHICDVKNLWLVHDLPI